MSDSLEGKTEEHWTRRFGRGSLKAAQAGARAAKAAALKANEFYFDHKIGCDATAWFIGGATAGMEGTAALLQTDLLTGALVAGVAAGYVPIAERIAKIGGKVKNWKDGLARAAYTLIPGEALLHTAANLQTIIPENARELFNDIGKMAIHTPEYLALLVAAYGLEKGGMTLWNATRPVATDTERRDAIKRIGRSAVAGAGMLIAARTGLDQLADLFTSYPQDSKRREDLGMQIIVGKDKVISDGGIINIDVNATQAGKYSGKNLTVRYFMVDREDGIPYEGSSSFYDDLIYLGERSDFTISNNGRGHIDGVFSQEDSLEDAFSEGSVFINPMASRKADSNRFKFLVEMWDGDKKLDYKWWGGESLDDHLFTFEKEKAPKQSNKPIERVDSDERKVFIYKQVLNSSRMDAETLAIADYLHPHFLDLRKKRRGFKFSQRCSDKKATEMTKEAKDNNLRVLPMVSIFGKRHVNHILNNPNSAADLISKEVIDKGYDGILIDVETINIGAERSDDLVTLMQKIRERLPETKYEIGVAVSPRFQGSTRKGFRHHGLYDYEGLAKHVNFIEIMAYDFHKGRRGASPVMPADKLPGIIEYAQQHAGEKAVILFPFYGYVWNKDGSKRGCLSSRNNGKYLEKAISSGIVNGELKIVTPDRIIYTQNGEVFRNRLDLLAASGIQNVGGWRQTHATREIFNEIARYKRA